MAKADWPLNQKKSLLVPTEKIEFLGAEWSNNGEIKRSASGTRLTEILLKKVKESPPPQKELEIIRGFLFFYSAFAGHLHGIVLPWLAMLESMRDMFYPLVRDIIRTDTTRFKRKTKQRAIVISNATETALGKYIKTHEER